MSTCYSSGVQVVTAIDYSGRGCGFNPGRGHVFRELSPALTFKYMDKSKKQSSDWQKQTQSVGSIIKGCPVYQ